MQGHAALVLVALCTAVEGARFPSSLPGLGLARPGSVPIPNGPAPSGANNTAALYQAVRRDFIFFERFAALLLRTAQRAISMVQEWCARSIGFPPRVMVVQLSGVILADRK